TCPARAGCHKGATWATINRSMPPMVRMMARPPAVTVQRAALSLRRRAASAPAPQGAEARGTPGPSGMACRVSVCAIGFQPLTVPYPVPTGAAARRASSLLQPGKLLGDHLGGQGQVPVPDDGLLAFPGEDVAHELVDDGRQGLAGSLVDV